MPQIHEIEVQSAIQMMDDVDGEEVIGEAKTNRHLNFFKHYYSGDTVRNPTENEAWHQIQRCQTTILP